MQPAAETVLHDIADDTIVPPVGPGPEPSLMGMRLGTDAEPDPGG